MFSYHLFLSAPLLPHSPSAYPIKSPESHPFTPCHLSSIIITLFSTGWPLGGSNRSQRETNRNPREEPFLYLEKQVLQSGVSPLKELSLSKGLGEKHHTSFHASTQKTRREPRPWQTACPVPSQQVLDLQGRGQRPGRKEGKAPRGSPMNQPAVSQM